MKWNKIETDKSWEDLGYFWSSESYGDWYIDISYHRERWLVRLTHQGGNLQDDVEVGYFDTLKAAKAAGLKAMGTHLEDSIAEIKLAIKKLKA